MKKIKLIQPILVASAAATPIVTLATACSKQDYSELAAELKDRQIARFQEMSKIAHATWYVGNMVEYIKEQMRGMGYGYEGNPVGQDNWSKIKTVHDMIESEYGEAGTTQKPYGNIWYDIPASKGCENAPKIILQAHVDMTISFSGITPEQKEEQREKWMKSAEDGGGVITDYDLDSETLQSTGETSLGADNGMGVALLLEIAEKCREDNEAFKHGVIRLLFTADESGATDALYDTDGKTIIIPAFAASADLLQYDENPEKTFLGYNGEQVAALDSLYDVGPFDYLPDEQHPENIIKHAFRNVISLDGVAKGEIFQSAAGVHECILAQDVKTSDDGVDTLKAGIKSAGGAWSDEPESSTIDAGLHKYTLSVSGLTGGHSGLDMNTECGNALQMLMQMLAMDDEQFRIINVTSSDSAYQICKSASITFTSVLPKSLMLAKRQTWWKIFTGAYPYEDKLNITLTLDDIPTTDTLALKNKPSLEVVVFSNLMKFGPQTWFDEERTQIETSCNFGPLTIGVPTPGTKPAEVLMSVDFHVVSRSADQEALDMFTDTIHTYTDLIFQELPFSEGNTQHIEDPVWQYDSTNSLIDMVDNSFKSYGYSPKNVNCHGWVELACMPAAFPEGIKVEMAAFGPTILNSHTVSETVWTDTLDSVIKVVLTTCHNLC